MASHENVVDRMEILVRQWEKQGDRRAIFLSCYLLMTRNMLIAIEKDEFGDSNWVKQLLNRFADYYFIALEAYENEHPETPVVWKFTMEEAKKERSFVLQNLLLGVNAHINYDLVYTLEELLAVEWGSMSETERAIRYSDHCQVNDVIRRTIDSVQDTIIEKRVPQLDLIDKAFGPLDEWSTSWLIGRWRDEVWENALKLLETKEKKERMMLQRVLEKDAMGRAKLIANLF